MANAAVTGSRQLAAAAARPVVVPPPTRDSGQGSGNDVTTRKSSNRKAIGGGVRNPGAGGPYYSLRRDRGRGRVGFGEPAASAAGWQRRWLKRWPIPLPPGG